MIECLKYLWIIYQKILRNICDKIFNNSLKIFADHSLDLLERRDQTTPSLMLILKENKNKILFFQLSKTIALLREAYTPKAISYCKK